MSRSATEPSATAEVSDDLADDLIVGAGPIAKFLGRPAREIYYLDSIGRLPLFRWGSKLAGRKSTLRRHILELERAGRAG
jgi:hypothetical protein